MYCSNCGAEIKEGERFCVTCGAPVEDTEPRAKDPQWDALSVPVPTEEELAEEEAKLYEEARAILDRVDEKAKEKAPEVAAKVEAGAKRAGEEAKRVGKDAKAAAELAGEEASRYAAKASEAAKQAKEKAPEVAAKAEAGAKRAGEAAKEYAGKAAEGSKAAAAKAGESAKQVGESAKAHAGKAAGAVSETYKDLQQKAQKTELPPFFDKFTEERLTLAGLIAAAVAAFLGLFSWILFAGKDKSPLVLKLCDSGAARAIQVIWIILLVAVVLTTLGVAALELYRAFTKRGTDKTTYIGVANLVLFLFSFQFKYPNFIGDYLDAAQAYLATNGIGTVIYTFTIFNELYNEYPGLGGAVWLTLFGAASLAAHILVKRGYTFRKKEKTTE